MSCLPFPTLVSPGAEAETSLSEIPAKEIDIGLTTPLYTTFILSQKSSPHWVLEQPHTYLQISKELFFRLQQK
jgi:hypothetical protein